MSEEKNEISPEIVQRTLGLELGVNDSGEPTVRRYLLRLLKDVWHDGESFDGKRPFGNSSWEYDLYVPMVKAGIIEGKLDDEGYVEEVDDPEADAIINACIDSLDYTEPSK